jgi:hypothetical protein
VMLVVVAKLSRPTRTPADRPKRQQCRTRSWTTSMVAAHKGPRAHGETKIDGKERPRRWLVVYRPHVRSIDSLGAPELRSRWRWKQTQAQFQLAVVCNLGETRCDQGSSFLRMQG